MLSRILVALVLLGLLVPPAWADDVPSPEPDDRGPDALHEGEGGFDSRETLVGDLEHATHENAEEAPRGFGDSWLLLPLVAYTPETSVFAALFGSMWWKPDDTSQIDEVCSWGAAVLYTWKQQFVAGQELDLHFDQGVWQFSHAVGYSDYVDEWYGIGGQNDGRAETFDYTEVLIEHSVRRRIVPQVYVSLLQYLTWTRLDDVEDGGEFDTGVAPGSDIEVVSGPGIGFDWDTRDRQNNPRRGHLASAQLSLFAPAFGTSHSHGRIDLDLRGFIPAWRDHVVATQFFTRLQPGEPGFSSQAEMGGKDLQRGIFEGRWRDRNLWVLQTEYRAPIVWRIGAVAFGGVGNVFDGSDTLFDGGLKWSVGGGLRFALAPDEGVNLRFDYGRGAQGEGGFYISIREAF